MGLENSPFKVMALFLYKISDMVEKEKDFMD
jgi:hypothetical protein